MEKPREYRIYRPNKNGNGTASAWELSYKPDNKYNPWILFLRFAKQSGVDSNGNASFDSWKGAVNVKLGDNDVAELLAVFSGKKDSVGFNGSLFHKSPKGGNKILKCNYVEGGFNLSLSAQDENKTNVGQFYQVISFAEAEILSVLLKKYIERSYNW